MKILPPNPKYAELFFQWRNEENTLRFNPVKNKTLEEIRNDLTDQPKDLLNLNEEAKYQWMIEFQNEIVGSVSFAGYNPMMKFGEVGYMIGQSHQGKGIATSAVKLWTGKLFENSNIRKLTASVAEPNVASLRVLEKVGFRREGILLEHYLIGGLPVNQVVFGILRSDWKSIHR